MRGTVPGMSEDDFVAAAEAAKTGCPVSQALTGTTITLTAIARPRSNRGSGAGDGSRPAAW